MKQINLEKILNLNLRRLAFIAVIWMICVVLHNIISGLLNIEEPVFFILAVIVIPIYLIISLIYSAFFKKKKGNRRK